MHAAQIRQQITDRILAALEKGTKPWARPWRNDPHSGHPTSMATLKPYTGINPILLDLASMDKGYAGRYWGTFQQWKSRGACVRPGQKACWVVLYKTVVKEHENGDIDKYPLMKMFPVFCIDQVHGCDELRPDANATNDGAIDYSGADELIRATGVEIKHGGNVAAYSTVAGNIKIPFKSKFNSEECYYSTLFHELSHWADHKLGAEMGKRFGDDDYSFGELVAEISACYLCDAVRIPAAPRIGDSESYLAGWIGKMKADNTYILKASSRAARTADYVLACMKIEASV